MALFDKFKRKKEDKKADEPNVLDMVKETPAKEASEATAPKDNTGSAHRILKHHHLSEKTNLFSATGRYVFKVDRTANKIEVKKAIEKVYDVHVTKVNMMIVPGKSRRQGRTVGSTQEWKKAIVTLRTGESIAGLAEGV
jgi:large subunit ribosomal protein L23